MLFEVATDKATVEYNASDGGWLRKILADEGSDIQVNQPVAILTETKDEKIEGYKPEAVSSGEEPASEEVEIPKKKELSEEKATAPAPKAAAVQQPVFTPEPPLEKYEFSPETNERLLASPLAKKQASDKGIDLSTVKGSGPRGRIMSKDLEGVTGSGIVGLGSRGMPTEKPGSYEEEKLTPMRKAIARRLQESKSYIPHFYVRQSIDADALVLVREQLKANQIAVSYNDFVIRACALALKEHPEINSGFNSSNNSVIRFKTVDISVAVTLPEGLITPIVRYADYKNLKELSNEIRSLAKRAKEGKLAENEYRGGSFTVSNLGMFGITDFQAIINPPQAAILAVGGILDAPVIKQGKVVPGSPEFNFVR